MADDIRISASLQDDISASLLRIEQRVSSLENKIDKLGRSGQRSGTAGAKGLDKLARSADDLTEEATQAAQATEEVGEEASKTGAKARVAATGLNKLARSANRTSRNMAFLNTTITAFKITGLVTGVFALAGGLSALAAGAAIAVGGLAPMSGVLAGIAPMFLAVRLAMLAAKLAAAELEGPLTRIKTQFSELGPVIAGGGLRSGLDYLATAMDRFVQVTGQGLRGLGAEIGAGARALGDWLKSPPLLRQVSAIFAGLRPILGNLIQAAISLAKAFLNLIQGSLPLALDMSEAIRWIAASLADWTAEVLANGRMTAWLQKSWTIFSRTVGVLVDLVIGAYRVFRIAGGYANEFGVAAEQAAAKFRAWTGSAEGQARIAKYFQDSLPALREMGRLLGMAAAGFAGLAANQNVAPLLEQIRTQFAPALGELVTKLSGEGGLGPALISAATALVRLLASMDFSGLTMFVQAIASVANALVWMTQNIPGASFVLSGLLASFLGFKLLGPVFALISQGSKAFAWISEVSEKSKFLTSIGSKIGTVFSTLGGIFVTLGGRILMVLRIIGAAFMASPIGLAITLIIGLIVLLVTKFEWFRDAAIAVWEWIANAAKSAWDFIVGIWNGLVSVASTVWDGIAAAWQTVVDVVVGIATAMWESGIRPVWEVIKTAALAAWEVIKFAVQTAVYIIVGIITIIAIVGKAIWDVIATAATIVWEGVLRPVFEAIGSVAMTVWDLIKTGAAIVWNAIGSSLQFVWESIIKPVWDFFSSYVTNLWNGISLAAQIAWDFISGGLQWAWDNVIKPVWDTLSSVATEAWDLIKSGAQVVSDTLTAIWEPVSEFFGKIWDGIGKAGTAVWDGIKSAAQSVADAVTGIWDGVMGVVKKVWNFIADGWNSIPSFTVPDWIPGIGGKTFGLPKLPTLWHGGEAPGGKAIVGEHGPEPLVVGGRVAGMVGMNGPEIASIPKGGYVVPNLRTLDALPGLAKTLPTGVAAAVARAVPGYAGVASPRAGRGGQSGLTQAVRQLASAVSGQMPPVHVHGSDPERIRTAVGEAWRQHQREERARGRYDYTAGGG